MGSASEGKVLNIMDRNGTVNKAYEDDVYDISMRTSGSVTDPTIETIDTRIKGSSGWNNSIEFLMSCVALSVGFGNVWRFPFTAYENGGGAFLIPYIILLILVGKPFYYLEMIVGQFSGRSSVKVWSVSPGFIGEIFTIQFLVSNYGVMENKFGLIKNRI